MMYKTIALELLQQRQELHEQLKSQRMLLPAVNSLACELKTRHEAWQEQLSQAKPDSDASQIASEALELAVQELENSLPSGSPPNASEPLSLDAAMAFIRNHTPRA